MNLIGLMQLIFYHLKMIEVHGFFLQKDVYMYYGLSNYYQNHRRYVRSRDDNQIHGDVVTSTSLNSDCEPYRTKSISSSVSKPIAPCGAIANSLFNGI